MALKKANKEEVQKPYVLHNLCQTDRVWYNKETHSFNGDMQWSFDEMPETSTLDLNFARNAAINGIVFDKSPDGFGDIEDEPIYLLTEMNPDENKVLELVTAVPATDEAFLAAVKADYPGAKVVHVPEYQKTIELEEDKSMTEYNSKKEDILENLYDLMNAAEGRKENEVVSFPQFNVRGFEVNGISFHYGIDRFKYYQLQSPLTSFPGMQNYKLEDFFTHLEPGQQDGILKGLKDAVKAVKSEKKEKSNQVKM